MLPFDIPRRLTVGEFVKKTKKTKCKEYNTWSCITCKNLGYIQGCLNAKEKISIKNLNTQLPYIIDRAETMQQEN